jgi:hypothetical protein
MTLGTRALLAVSPKKKGLDPLAGHLEGKLNLVVSGAPSHLVYFKYKLYSRNSLSLGLL